MDKNKTNSNRYNNDNNYDNSNNKNRKKNYVQEKDTSIYGQSAAFDLAAQSLTLSKTFFDNVDRDIMKWKYRECALWLEDVFTLNNEHIESYKNNFLKQSIDGVMLLGAGNNEALLRAYGFESEIQLHKAKIAIGQLINYNILYQKEKNYFSLEEQYLQRGGSNHTITEIELIYWTPLDVFDFLKRQSKLSKFIKPLAMRSISGRDIKNLIGSTVRPTEWVEIYESCKADSREIEIFESTFKTLNQKLEDTLKRKEETRKKSLQILLPEITGKSNINQIKKVGGGNFGEVWLVNYKGQKAARKTIAATSEKVNNKLEIIRNKLKYEASMLHKSKGSGVIKLLGFGNDVGDVPYLLTEYLFNKSVADQIYMARSDNVRSIFHPRNPNNLDTLSRNSNKDPVLFQAVRISKDVASALERIHSIGVIHLDIAARNVLLDGSMRPKICDFGMAVNLEDIIQYQDSLVAAEAENIIKSDFALLRDDKKQSLEDTFIATRLDEYKKDGPKSWMPHWVFDSNNGRVDAKADVYAFGCFMYEMIKQEQPHHEVSIKDVIDNKTKGPYNPNTNGLDHRYADIMQFCWDGYEDQKPIAIILQELKQLHSSLMASSSTNNQSYEKFKSATSQQNDPKSIYAIAKDDEESIPSYSDDSIPKTKVLGENMIRLCRQQGIDDSQADGLKPYFDEGMDRTEMEDMLLYSFDIKDHKQVEICLLCIYIDNNNNQVQMVQLCLEYIAKLARDNHSSIDEDDTWYLLTNHVIRIVESVESSNLSEEYEKILLSSCVKALSALIDGKTVPFDLELLLNKVIKIAINLYKKYAKFDDNSAANLAEFVTVLCKFSPLAISKLCEEKIVKLLIETLDCHKLNEKVVTLSVGTFIYFPIEELIAPNHIEKTDGDLIAEWELLYKCFIGIVNLYLNNSYDSSEDVIEKCLYNFNNICENNIAYPNMTSLVKIFFNVNKEDITLLVKVIYSYPNNFRIQEVSIGVLACILEFSKEIVVDNSTKKLSPPVSSIDRVQVYNDNDQSFQLLLLAMEKFSVDDKISIGLKQSEDFNNKKLSQGIYNPGLSRAMYEYSNKSSSYQYQSKQYNNVNTAYNYSGDTDINNIVQRMKSEYDRGQLEKLLFDDDGNLVSAADLQKNAARVVGVCCEYCPNLRVSLHRTEFIDLAVAAFMHHNDTVPLVVHACHSLFSVCRGDENNQERLWDLRLLNQLTQYLSKYMEMEKNNTNWVVVEAVICTLVGLLEPSDDLIKIIDDINKATDLSESDKLNFITEHKKSKKSYNVTQEIIRLPIESKEKADDKRYSTLLEKFALKTTEFHIIPDCDQLVSIFFKLISILKFWKHDYEKFQDNAVFLDLRNCDIFSKGALLQYLYNRFYQEGRVGKTVDFNKVNSVDTYKQSIDVVNKITEDSGSYLKKILKQYTLVDFVQFLMKPHLSHPYVCASGMAIITSVFTSMTVTKKWKIGEELPYSDGDLLLFRHRMLEGDLSTIKSCCIQTKISQTDHPVLIRYTLWLLVIFISQRDLTYEDIDVIRKHLKSISGEIVSKSTDNYDVKMEVKAIIEQIFNELTSLVEEGKQLSIELSNLGFIEWSILVLKRYENYYSIQVLVTIFLIWMEHHKMLVPRKSKLKDLKPLIRRNIDRKDDFVNIKDEGHDTFIIGYDISSFGKLAVHSQKLLRLIDFHLNEREVEQEVVVWDGFLRPKSIIITNIEPHANPEPLYVFNVIWDNKPENRWMNALSFTAFLKLSQELQNEFITYPSFPNKIVNDSGFLKNIKPEFLEKRRETIQNWINAAMSVPALHFSETFIKAITIASKLETVVLKSVRTFDPVKTFQNIPEFPFVVSAVVYNEVEKFVIIGTGNMRRGMLGSRTKPRGTLGVYFLSSANKRNPNEITLSKGVVSVLWEEKRRCIIIGLASGTVIFFRLSSDCTSLSYVSELDYHANAINGMSLDYTGNYFVAVSGGGQLTVYGFDEGHTKIQGVLKETFVSTAYDTGESLIFCGTINGDIIIYSGLLSGQSKSVDLLEKITTSQYHQNKIKSSITYLEFIEETRLLYVASSDVVLIYFIGLRNSLKPQLKWKISLNLDSSICNILVVNRGKQIAIIEKSGKVGFYDFSKRAQRIPDEIISSQSSFSVSRTTSNNQNLISAMTEKSFSGTASNLMEWDDVIRSNNINVLWDYLRGHGCSDTSTMTRLELIRKVQEVSGRSLIEISLALHKNLYEPQLLFQWTIGTNINVISSSFIEELQIFIFGCSNGKIYCSSLSDFFPAFDGGDKHSIILKRDFVTSYKPVEIKVTTFSSRGKDSILNK